MQQLTPTHPNQAVYPGTSFRRGKIKQWPFRVVSQNEPVVCDVMANAKRIVATTRRHFLTTEER